MHVRDFRLLTYFAAVARTGSVRAAARELHVSAPVVSTAVSELETALESSLLRRGRAGMTLTPAGERVFEHARQMLDCADRAMHATRSGPPAGAVRVTLPTELSLDWLPPLLRRFEARYPQVHTIIHASDEMVRLGSSDFDAAIRVRLVAERSDAADAFAFFRLLLVGAPDLRASARTPLAKRLTDLPYIGSSDGGEMRNLRVRARRGGTWREVTVRARFQVNNKHVARELARQGFGAALLLEPTARNAIDNGELIDLAPGHTFGLGAAGFELRDAQPSAAARAFAAFVTADDDAPD